MDQALFRLRDHHYAFHGVIKGIAEDRTDVRYVQPAQKRAVRHACDPHIQLPRFSERRGKNGVEHRVAGPLGKPPFIEFIFHHIQPGFPLLGTGLPAQPVDLVLYVVLHHMQHFFALLIIAELLVLAVEHVAHGVELFLRKELGDTALEAHEDRYARPVRQCPDRKYVLCHPARERRSREKKTEIAENER